MVTKQKDLYTSSSLMTTMGQDSLEKRAAEGLEEARKLLAEVDSLAKQVSAYRGHMPGTSKRIDELNSQLASTLQTAYDSLEKVSKNASPDEARAIRETLDRINSQARSEPSLFYTLMTQQPAYQPPLSVEEGLRRLEQAINSEPRQ